MSGFEAFIPYAVGALGATAATSLMADKSTPAAAPAPSVTPPTPMPDDKMKNQAKRRSIAEQRARQGRASTILSDTSNDALGG